MLVNPVSGSSKGRQIYKKYGAGIFRMAHIETDVIGTYNIMKTCPCNVQPLTPHFYIVNNYMEGSGSATIK